MHAMVVTAVAVGIAGGVGWILTHVNYFVRKKERVEVGRTPSPPQPLSYRWGGLVIAAGFFSSLLFDNRLVVDDALCTLIIGSVFALALGFLDDCTPLYWLQQLFGQVFLAMVLIFSGMEITQLNLGEGNVILFNSWFSWAGSFVTVLWVLLVMNAINWMDGADGLMGSVVGVALLVLAYLSWQPSVNQPTLVFLMMMLFGALIGFLFFNWYPARLIAGSSGASFLGFLVATLSVYAGAKVATALLVLAIPILDLCSVILTRIRKRKSPFLPDKNHLHHILLSLGFSSRAVALIYVSVTGIMGILALSARSFEKVGVFFLVGIFFFLTLFWMQWMLAVKKSA